MHIDPTDRICGYPILAIRKLFLYTNLGPTHIEFAAHILGVSEREARRLARELVAEGYWVRSEQSSERHTYFENTHRANRIAVAIAARPLTRSTALRLLFGLLDRVELLPTKPFSHTVERAYAFGSITEEAPRLSDVDVALLLVPKHSNLALQQALENERTRAREENSHLGGIVARLFWPVTETMQFLRARSGYLHLQHYLPQESMPEFVKAVQIHPHISRESLRKRLADHAEDPKLSD
jgi:hypothetical protein